MPLRRFKFIIKFSFCSFAESWRSMPSIVLTSWDLGICLTIEAKLRFAKSKGISCCLHKLIIARAIAGSDSQYSRRFSSALFMDSRQPVIEAGCADKLSSLQTESLTLCAEILVANAVI